MNLTRRLILAFLELRVGLPLRLGFLAVLMVALPLAVVIDLGRSALWRSRLAALTISPVLRCPAGHAIEAVGHYSCPACGYVAGNIHAAAPCPSCSSLADIRCPCGRTVPHPLLGEKP